MTDVEWKNAEDKLCLEDEIEEALNRLEDSRQPTKWQIARSRDALAAVAGRLLQAR